MKFYHVKDDYIALLKKYDRNVDDNKHERRPYIGVVLNINGTSYFAPFTSPKAKHKKMKNTKDFRKIAGGAYGAINFNNMIPVVSDALILIDILTVEDVNYQRLLQNQYTSIRADQDKIKEVAKNLYELVSKKDDELTSNDLKIKKRCCNFKLLETIAPTYINISDETKTEVATDKESVISKSIVKTDNQTITQ